MRNPLAPARHIERLRPDAVRRRYPGYRWRVLESTFLGYAAFYLVRNNVPVIAKDLQAALDYSKSDIGSIGAVTALAYGAGKFLMGAWSDRSNPRTFMAVGLFLTALCNFAFGFVHNLSLHVWLWGLNGLFQGMGWPPCGRSMGHWFSERERGLTFSIWNTSHNLGGGIAGFVAAWAASNFGGWQWAFFVPGVLALIGSVYIFLRLVDTPQSCGLPPVEEFNNDYTQAQQNGQAPERDLTARELFIDNVFANRYILLLALANFFAYISRYSMIDWGPMYLREMKGASILGGGVGITIVEFSGIPSTIALGWLSDRLGGRRGVVSTLCMLPIMGAFAAMLIIPPEMIWLDMVMLGVIGLFVYPVINLIVIQALDLTSKKAIGTAAGFIGLLGYLGKTAENKGFGLMLDRLIASRGPEAAWHAVIASIFACSLLAMLLLSLTWKLKPRA